MRKFTTLGGLVVGLFAISAAASWFLKSGSGASGEGHTAEAVPDKAGKSLKAGALPGGGGPPPSYAPAVRAPYNPGADEAAKLISQVREQQQAVRAREQSLATRQKHLEIIYQDLRSEREALDKMRKEVQDELAALAEKVGKLERKTGELQQERQKVSAQVLELKQTMSEVEKVEHERVKQLAGMCDTMDPESAAEILQVMADKGKMDTAVKILATMKERNASKVLAQFPDRNTVVQLIDNVKRLRQPTNAKLP